MLSQRGGGGGDEKKMAEEEMDSYKIQLDDALKRFSISDAFNLKA